MRRHRAWSTLYVHRKFSCIRSYIFIFRYALKRLTHYNSMAAASNTTTASANPNAATRRVPGIMEQATTTTVLCSDTTVASLLEEQHYTGTVIQPLATHDVGGVGCALDMGANDAVPPVAEHNNQQQQQQQLWPADSSYRYRCLVQSPQLKGIPVVS
jgi:hypothetical protein